jgi:hypothetical protein
MVKSLMVKDLADAKRYVDRIKKGLIKNPFANRDCTDSLKIFAEKKDGEPMKLMDKFSVDVWLMNEKEYEKMEDKWK